MDAGQIRVSSVARGSGCLIVAGGELTVATEDEFTELVALALAGVHGPVVFDVSGLTFADVAGARALARAVRAVRPGEARLQGRIPAVRRVLDTLGLELPYRIERSVPAPVRPRPDTPVGTVSRGAALTAMTRETASNSRQAAMRASEAMSRLAVTYARLALNGRYRTPPKSEDRGRLLGLSARALDLSRQYMRHATPAP